MPEDSSTAIERERFGSPDRGGPSVEHPLKRARLADEALAAAEARQLVGTLTDRELYLVGLALYAGEGAKTGTALRFANTDPNLIRLFRWWLRRCFAVDESRLRIALYLHTDLDLEVAIAFWADATGIPTAQFTKPYRAVADASRRKAKHPMGCPSVRYADAALFRRVQAGMNALHYDGSFPG